MTLTATEHKYVELNEAGVAFVAGTTMKVVELVETQMAYGWSPQEIHLNHRYLTMSQIHSAFAYYWDNKPELDAEIERREEYVKRAEREAGESPLAARLREEKLRRSDILNEESDSNLTTEEIARRGKQLYRQHLRNRVETEENIGQPIAIDIKTVDYEIDKDLMTACDRLKTKHPDAIIWSERIGYNAVYAIGGTLYRTAR